MTYFTTAAGELAKPTTMVLVHGAFADGGRKMATP
jgi:hypothetical protein